MPDANAEADDAAGDQPADSPEAVNDAESVIARAEAQAAPDEAEQVDFAAEDGPPAETPDAAAAVAAAEMGSEAAARDEERRTMNGAREADMHFLRPPDEAAATDDHDDHDHDDHDHVHAPGRRGVPGPAKAAGPILMVVALGWLVRQFLKRPKKKSKRR